MVTFLAALVLFVLGLRSDDPESVQDVTYFAIAGASVVSAVTLAALGHGLEVLVSIYEVIRRRD